MQGLNYDDRLKHLGLMKLEGRRMRRMRSDLLETLKTVNGKYDINPELFFQLDEGGRREHDQKLFKKRFRLDVRKNVFLTELLIIRICSLPVASTLALFTFSRKHLSSELQLAA